MNFLVHSQKELLFEGRVDYDLNWNDHAVFDSKVIVVMLVHHNGSEINRAINSILNQESETTFALLIIDDYGGYLKSHGPVLNDNRIAIAEIKACSVSQARNIAHYIVKSRFHGADWICRLDADDEIADPYAIQAITAELEGLDSSVNWALAGNTLELDGQKINRVNLAEPDLLTQKGVLKRLEMMASGIPEGELPSCNLWVRAGFKAIYPDIESAEDHWLVAHLLLNKAGEGAILSELNHCKYSLSGSVTHENKVSGSYEDSRNKLLVSALHWIGKTDDEDELICLGWGAEGVVWKQGNMLRKRFHNLIITDEKVEWLRSLDKLPMPSVSWNFIEGSWEAHYIFEETQPTDDVSLPMLSRFIETCIAQQVVFLNINRENFRIKDGELYCIDIGNQIVPFEVRYFRDMCARLQLVFRNGVTDLDSKKMAKVFRNNIDEMRGLEQFEQFYHREIHKFVYNQGSFIKPRRDVQPAKRFHESITLMVKCCTMEENLIEQQANHIISQICRYDEFSERILLLDPKEGGLLRQYTEGNIEKLSEIAERLKRKNVFDRVLISPFEGHEDLAEDTYQRWFGVQCNETHNTEGIPVFPQLWGFEQVSTRYLLQMDADVMIGREEDDDVITSMTNALVEEHVFGIGFNIPQLMGTEFKAYSGKFVPEVRFGLFDLKRIFNERPFPNQINKGHLSTSWYRSMEQFQNDSDWGCLRGGDPRSWYIHPPNILKMNLPYYDRALDLVEQGMIPDSQRGKWDLIDEIQKWRYPLRNEELIFTMMLSDSVPHWTRAALRSLVIQDNVEWGAVIFDNCSSPQNQSWLASLIKELGGRFTLVKRRFEPIDPTFIKEVLSEICTNNPMIFTLSEKEILFDNTVVSQINTSLLANHSCIIAPSYLASQPLGLNEGTTPMRTDQFNVPSSVRGIRLSLFDGCSDDALYRMARDESLELKTFVVYNADMTLNTENNALRPTTYIPNMKKIEIDITYLCNLSCAGCSRSSAQAPSNKHMPIEMIKNFLKETEDRGLVWESVHLLGGEPTLHPQFLEIIGLLDKWFMMNSPETDLKVITNGVGNKVESQNNNIPDKWRYDNSLKHDRDTSYFEPFNLAPVDLPEWKDEDFTKGCYIPQDSGIGLTPYGYFHCAIAGGIERIMKLGNGFNKIPEHPWEFLEMMENYCKFCGHFLSDSFMERSDRTENSSTTPEATSDTWQAAYNKWETEGDC